MPKLFRYLEPTFFAGLFDDPLLLIRIRPMGRAILFDAGQMHHLAKRVLKSLDAIFISHAHMDHFMGMDCFIRHSHVSPRTTQVFGPPGIARKMESKFASYDWNLADTFWGDIRVGEVDGDLIKCTRYHGPSAFEGSPDGEYRGAIYSNPFLRVDGALCDHHIPVLCFRITEGRAFTVDERRLAEAGLVKGDWLKDLERLFHQNEMEGSPVTVLMKKEENVEEGRVEDAGVLYLQIQKTEDPASIGYLTDVGFLPENLERAAKLLQGVTLLICECAFLSADQEKARASRHLCTSDLNVILDRLRPRYLLPMHLSKGYMGRSHLLYEEIEPPPGVTVLKVPDRVTPRPLMASEVPEPEAIN